MCKVISKYKLYLILNNEKNFHEKKLLKYKNSFYLLLYRPPCMNKKKLQRIKMDQRK
jgi:hypothetical protein